MTNKSSFIHGVASSAAIDTAGEVVDIAGLDCSSLIGGAINFEHKSEIPAQIIGKILEYKKIFSEKDCETDEHKYFWQKTQMPFLYVLGRLYDDRQLSAKEAAAIFMDDAAHPNEKPMFGFSIEGSKLDKNGMVIVKSIARKVTVTATSANKQCLAELIPTKKASRNDPDSIFKGEIEFFNPSAKYLETLQKKEKEMQKDIGSGGGAMIGDSLAMSEMKKSADGWKHTGGGHFSHPEHGIVSVAKQPTGEFHVKHNGAMAGIGGQKGSFGSAKEAGAHAGSYMRGVSSKKILPPSSANRPSPSMLGKSLEAGSGMSAPSSLTQGAALAREDMGGKMKKASGFGMGIGTMSGKNTSNAPKEETAGVSTAMNTTVGKSDTGGMGTMGLAASEKKSKWLQRAEQVYKTWEKREQFETFMKSKMPHLTKGEIQAIGQTIALKKSVEAEKSMSKMFSTFFTKGTDIMMATEKK